MKVEYLGPDEIDVPSLGLVVKPGDVVEVSDKDAESYVHQAIWRKSKKTNTPDPDPVAEPASDNTTDEEGDK